MSLFEKNLCKIKQYNEKLYEKLYNYSISELAGFEIVSSASGDTNLIYNNIPLHCLDNPLEEAFIEFNKVKNANDIILICGLGLGYLLRKVFQGTSSRIIVFEPNLDILRFTFEAVDLFPELESGRVFITSSLDETDDILSAIASHKDDISILKLKYTDNLYPEDVRLMQNELTKIMANIRSNYITLFSKAETWLGNALAKFKQDKNDHLFNILENKFVNKTALIVGAGPSLEENIEIIKTNREKFIIFCANVAYKNLIEKGITPDFTVYIDAEDFLHTIKNYEHSNTNIINHISSNLNVLNDVNPNSLFTFYCNNDLFSRWAAKTANFSIEEYQTKGFSSHLALLAAYNMGCNPIIITGQDLAYPNGQFYAKGSFWADKNIEDEAYQKKVKKLENTARIEIKGQNGETLLTSTDYAGFIKHYEEFAQEKGSKVRLINCSTNGAQINGFENQNLQTLVNNLLPTGINMKESLETIIETEIDPIIDNYEHILMQIKLFKKDLEKASSYAAQGLKNIKSLEMEIKKRPLNHVTTGQFINKVLISFDSIEKNLFKKWDFSMYIALQELMEFNKFIDNKLSQNDLAMFTELCGISKAFFSKCNANINFLQKLTSKY